MKPSAEAVIDIFNYYIEQNNMYLMTQEEHQRYLKKYKVLTELEEAIKKEIDRTNDFILEDAGLIQITAMRKAANEARQSILYTIQKLKEKYK